MAKKQTVSESGRRLIKQHEGLRLTAYRDLGYPDLWAIGYGHTGPDVYRGLTISEDRAEALLAQDLEKHEAEVRRLTKGANTPQAAFDALVSFDFNTGELHSSTLLKKHRAGLHAAAAREFHRWKYSNGKVMAGLIRRRADEAKLYASAYSWSN